jgi:alkylation response protein AidB-like acyl-CoA dehydrogenase
MDFGLSEEQELLQETVRGFVARDCPIARVRQIFESPDGFDPALFRGLAELGLTGLLVPERQGGAGLELVDLALACEVLGEGAVPGPLIQHCLAGLAIRLGGSDAQRERWLPRLASGELLATLALAEPGQRWLPEHWRTGAARGALHGAKQLCVHAAEADLIVVGTDGGGLALVERGARGLALEPFDGLDRTRRACSLAFDATPCELLPDGPSVSGRICDAGLVLLASDAFGAGWRLIRAAIEYLGTREQFGTPLVQFQAIKHQLANLATDLEPARALWWYAAHAFDRIPQESARAAAIAKAHVCERAMAIARDVVELHGGIGFTWECDVHLWYKRILFDRAWLGSPGLLRERSAALAGWTAP